MKISPRPQKIFLVFFLFLSILPVTTQAISLGTLQKSNYAEVEKGKTIELTVLFWNLENSSSLVKFDTKSPEDLVVVQPNEFILNQSKIGPPYDDGEYVNTPSGDVKTFPVKVLIRALENANEGEHDVTVLTNAEGFETGIKFAQEKTFNFKINVTSVLKKQDNNTILQNFQNQLSNIRETILSGMATLPKLDYRYTIIFIAIALILLISYLVYKFAPI